MADDMATDIATSFPFFYPLKNSHKTTIWNLTKVTAKYSEITDLNLDQFHMVVWITTQVQTVQKTTTTLLLFILTVGTVFEEEDENAFGPNCLAAALLNS